VKVVDSLDDLRHERPLVIAIGTFDGVHRGHVYMLDQARTRARELGLDIGIITFDPAPALVLKPDLADYQITGRDTKIKLLEALDPDVLAVLPFTRALAALSAEEFIDKLEVGLSLAEFWMGDDFRFGHDREGGIPYLLERAARSEFAVHVVARQGVEAGAAGVSSSAVRDAIRAGAMDVVTSELGRRFTLTGPVVHGFKRGRELGYPTANLGLPSEQIVPAAGIYAAIAVLPGGERFASAVSVGTNPQFKGETTTVEAYILDFDRDIYDETITLEFVAHLRGQGVYPTLEGLLTQMAQDVEDTRTAVAPLIK